MNTTLHTITIAEPYISAGESDTGKWVRCDIRFTAGDRRASINVRRYSSGGAVFGFEESNVENGLDGASMCDIWTGTPADDVLMPDGSAPTKAKWERFLAEIGKSARAHINARIGGNGRESIVADTGMPA